MKPIEPRMQATLLEIYSVFIKRHFAMGPLTSSGDDVHDFWKFRRMLQARLLRIRKRPCLLTISGGIEAPTGPNKSAKSRSKLNSLRLSDNPAHNQSGRISDND